MKTYAVHIADIETPDLLRMFEQYPKETAALYNVKVGDIEGSLYLFAQPLDNPEQEVIDLTGEEDLEEFRNDFLSLFTGEHVGKWVYANDTQAPFIIQEYAVVEEEVDG